MADEKIYTFDELSPEEQAQAKILLAARQRDQDPGFLQRGLEGASETLGTVRRGWQPFMNMVGNAVDLPYNAANYLTGKGGEVPYPWQTPASPIGQTVAKYGNTVPEDATAALVAAVSAGLPIPAGMGAKSILTGARNMGALAGAGGLESYLEGKPTEQGIQSGLFAGLLREGIPQAAQGAKWLGNKLSNTTPMAGAQTGQNVAGAVEGSNPTVAATGMLEGGSPQGWMRAQGTARPGQDYQSPEFQQVFNYLDRQIRGTLNRPGDMFPVEPEVHALIQAASPGRKVGTPTPTGIQYDITDALDAIQTLKALGARGADPRLSYGPRTAGADLEADMMRRLELASPELAAAKRGTQVDYDQARNLVAPLGGAANTQSEFMGSSPAVNAEAMRQLGRMAPDKGGLAGVLNQPQNRTILDALNPLAQMKVAGMSPYTSVPVGMATRVITKLPFLGRLATTHPEFPNTPINPMLGGISPYLGMGGANLGSLLGQ